MAREDTAYAVRAVISEVCGLGAVGNDWALAVQCGADSLSRVEIAMALEEQYGIDLGDAWVEWGTVQDVIDSVQQARTK